MKNYINFKSIFNKILFLLLISILPNIASANTGENVGVLCPSQKYIINGQADIIYNNLIDYSVSVGEDINTATISKIKYALYKGAVLLGTFTGQKYTHYFATTDKFTLKVDIQDDDKCSYSIQKDINVYKDISLYIGKDVPGIDTFDSSFNKKGTLFKRTNINISLSEQDFVQKISENAYYIKNAKYIILNYKNMNELFETLGKIKTLYSIDFNDKTIYLVSDENQNFLKRNLFKYLKLLDLKEINLINSTNLFNTINQINLGNKVTNGNTKIDMSNIDTGIMGFSKLIDYLIYNGFPSSLLYLILAGCLISLIISAFRQIIGLPVFSLYSPLLFGMGLYILGIKFTLLLFVIAFFATAIVRQFTKKFYLLHSAKTSMIVILYLLFVLLYLGVDKYFKLNLVDINVFLNNYIIFPIIYISIASSKIYKEGTSFFSKGFWILFIEFMLISFCAYFLLSWSTMELMLLSYPEVLILVLILQIIVGRFTGLQLIEYIRFRTIIGEEEE